MLRQTYIRDMPVEAFFSQIRSVENANDRLQNFVAAQHLYNSAIKEITTKLEILNEEFQIRYDHNPIHHLESRLKSPKSIVEKLVRLGHPVSTEAAREHIFDIAGIRVICHYTDDIYTIAQSLIRQDDIDLITIKDYIKNPKPNGYRSLHLLVKVPIFLKETTEIIPAEIQIRTIAMDFWASLEHQLRYKSSRSQSSELEAVLKECAEESSRLDSKMQEIFRKIQDDAQNGEK
ncbi:MAG: GTP pyrophosphokinase family protein [Firmicutes bacterium]|nr:GTP pyrophosphokinase family protein [Bacillota bacterium]